ncbi:MAG TPA: FAD-dependent oxidoreductase [Vicinamibacteria bacterium]|jgi:sarcosine oxidase|nr:FAD-dependent oxidoreductase [Vicinamibacteria bacterium]
MDGGAEGTGGLTRAEMGNAHHTHDVAVVGAGCFGAWTAWHLRRADRSVVLLDAYGPGNTRSSSGGESRIIRMGYGADDLYTRFARRSFDLWASLFRETGLPLFKPTGVLWLAREGDPLVSDTLATLRRLGVRHERLLRPDLEARFPQIALGDHTWALLEPESGVILARRAVSALVAEAVRAGVDYRAAHVLPPEGHGRLEALRTENGEGIHAREFVFACGPWLPKVFPGLLAGRIFPTRQEVFFFGPPAGDVRFSSPALPAWIDFGEEVYGIPDLEGRGFKVAPDRHGPAFEPDEGERLVSAESVARVREFLGRRFPALGKAPLLETRVCQYENTSSGDFLIDRHPDLENVWLAGGGSGHGFKHGPAVGEYVAERLKGAAAEEARFALSTKETVQKRAVY